MLLRRRLLSIRPRRCSGRSNLGVSCIFLFVSRRWRFDAARLRVVWLGRGPRLPHRLLSNTCAASVSPAASFIFFVVLVGLLRLQAGTSTEESSRACKSPIHHIHETTHVNCSGVARRIDCRAQPPLAPRDGQKSSRMSWLIILAQTREHSSTPLPLFHAFLRVRESGTSVLS